MNAAGWKRAVWIPAASLSVFALLYIPVEAQYANSPPRDTPSVPADPAPPSDLLLTVGQSHVVGSPVPIGRISMGFGEVAEATAVSPYEVLVSAKAPGVASLVIWQRGGGKLVFDLKVTASHYLTDSRVETVRSEIQRELPGRTLVEAGYSAIVGTHLIANELNYNQIDTRTLPASLNIFTAAGRNLLNTTFDNKNQLLQQAGFGKGCESAEAVLRRHTI